MYSGTGHITSTRVNLGMLRTRGMQRVKRRTRYVRFGTKVIPAEIKPVSAMAIYHREKRMKRAVARGIRKEILAYLLVTVILTTLGLMAYGLFY